MGHMGGEGAVREVGVGSGTHLDKRRQWKGEEKEWDGDERRNASLANQNSNSVKSGLRRGQSQL